jgi:AraC family transcriptional regulator
MVTAASSVIGLDVAKKLIVKGMAWFRTSGISHNIQAIRAVLWGKGKGVNSGENWGMARLSSALGDAKAAQGQNRILALKDGGIQPLVGKTPVGRPSPSPSLLVERFDLETSQWQTHLHTDQVVALCLRPPITEHERKGECGPESPLVQGQVAICDRNHWQSFYMRARTSFLCARISDSALKEAAHSLADLDHLELQSTPQADDPRMTSLLFALEAEREREYSSGRLFLDSVEAAIAALLVTSHGTIPTKPLLRWGGLPPHRIRRVLEFMHANLDKQVSLEDLAACTDLSTSHFSHQFRASMGASPYKYMVTLRIEQSKQMLRNSKLSVLDVALRVGFENQQHFATVFRRIAGVTPSGYRRQL